MTAVVSPIPELVSDAPERVELLGMPIDAVTERQALELLTRRLSRGQGAWVITPNLDILRQYHAKPAIRSLFEGPDAADVFLADGMPVIWASRMARIGRGRKGLPERVPGSGLVYSLAREAAQRGWRLYLLGGSPGAADAAGAKLRRRFPALQIAGTDCPPLGFEKDSGQMAAVEAKLVAAKPDIVYVALGFPKQEFLIQRLRPLLPRAAFLGVGISLSFIAGHVKRAPRWVQAIGLEWLHRLIQEPSRLARRYLLEDIPFAICRLLPHALRRRWGRR
ncbi:MAG TPA: WecB/TagA/CpsF family glycosyltransferase [Phycisphaerae bacterium]|nr:WecB/TagA/CpsF family glycosyltransferase [Phycisphaerae bacterium]